MKAKITRETILLYRLSPDTEKGALLEKLLKEQRITAIYLTEEDLSQTLGSLAGVAGYPKEEMRHEGEIPAEEFMAFYGFTNSRLNRFLNTYRQRGGSPIALKAVVTEHNRGWKLYQLFAELRREHALFQKYEQVQQLMELVRQDNSSPEAERLLVEGASLLQKQEDDVDKLDAVLNGLRDCLEQE